MLIRPDGSQAPSGSALLYHSLFGERQRENLERWQTAALPGEGTQLRVTLDREQIAWDGKLPMKLRVAALPKGKALTPATTVRGILWCVEDDPVATLGKNRLSPCEYGWLLAEQPQVIARQGSL